ncbi:HNH endonuclease signature motif containing protein [Bradyrhizobium japonicum]|uniref:HNH endonuclease signature motif containing protein n=1 Tax=Bradyrhizobium japonicum TaxID=375 RepID=UPI00040F1113|nr:HNH endonuclease signature motif containing protein [Bradyrhizobium japonicum]
MKIRELPSQSLLREHFDYNPETGVFTWKKVHYTNPHLLGKPAGALNRGYIMIGAPGHAQMGAHRLAWIYMHGPTIGGGEIDHIDGNPTNNAIANLRLATSRQQKQNKRVQSNNRSGLKGAYYHAAHKGKKWRSQIKVGEKLIFLGYFHTAEEAHAAYAQAAIEHFGEFARTA